MVHAGVGRESYFVVSVENHKAGGKQKAVGQVYTALDQLYVEGVQEAVVLAPVLRGYLPQTKLLQ